MFKISIDTIDGNRVKMKKRFKSRKSAEEFKDRLISVRKRIKDKRRRKLLSMNPRVVKA